MKNMKNETYFGYELSPSPKVVKLTWDRQSGGKRFLRRLFQSSLEFLGNSPCPVVPTTNRTNVGARSDFYCINNKHMDLVRLHWKERVHTMST
jgi:hypothetical protein